MKLDKWCENCQWWGAERAHDDNRPYGRCRQWAPRMGEQEVLPYHDPDRPDAAGPLIQRGAWPWTAFDDWCGAWESKASPEHPHAARAGDGT